MSPSLSVRQPSLRARWRVSTQLRRGRRTRAAARAPVQRHRREHKRRVGHQDARQRKRAARIQRRQERAQHCEDARSVRRQRTLARSRGAAHARPHPSLARRASCPAAPGRTRATAPSRSRTARCAGSAPSPRRWRPARRGTTSVRPRVQGSANHPGGCSHTCTTRQKARAMGVFCAARTPVRQPRVASSRSRTHARAAPPRLHDLVVAVGHGATGRGVGDVIARGRVIVVYRPVGRERQRQHERARRHRRVEDAPDVGRAHGGKPGGRRA